MIRHLRADVTQYTIWHLTNTAPAVARNPELRVAYLMNIDIEALSDYVENLMWGYARKGWLKRLPVTLDRLKHNIDDPRWLAKIAYHRGICALWREDRAQATSEIEILQPITSETADVDLLQIHLDLHGSDIGLIEKLAFFNRISSLSHSRADKLQYSGARAFEILMAGDEDGARRAFDAVIAMGREMEVEKPFNDTTETWFCRVLEGRAVIDQVDELFDEIDERFARLIGEEVKWSDLWRANLWRARGDSLRYAGRFEAARDAYRTSRSLVPSPELRTFEAECELRLKNPDEAYRLIRSVAVDKLDMSERADHAFTSFYIALVRGDRQSLLDSRDLLKGVATPQPYFQDRRQSYIILVGDALEALDNRQEMPKLGPILASLKKASRYLQLQPNWNGIGINGNAIIDDYIEHVEEKQTREAKDVPTYSGLKRASGKSSG